MTEVRKIVQEVLHELDKEGCFTILLTLVMVTYLEEPLERARFFNYDKKLELYFDSKDINRFTRIKALSAIIAKQINAKEVKGFERLLNLCAEKELVIKEREGPSEGMAWKGFGGVHSHYSLTELGRAFLVLQSALRCEGIDFRQIVIGDDWDAMLHAEIEQIITALVQKQLVVTSHNNCFSAKRAALSYITQLIFEFIAGAPKTVTLEQIRRFIWDKAGEIHLGEIPEALECLNPLLTKTKNTFSLNAKGKHARLGYASFIIEAAIKADDMEIVQYLYAGEDFMKSSQELLKQFSLWL